MNIILILIFVIFILCFFISFGIGTIFVKLLKHTKKAVIPYTEIPFYKSGPLHDQVEKGSAYLQTKSYQEVNTISSDGTKLHGYEFACEQPSQTFVICAHGFQSHGFNEYSMHMQYYHQMQCTMLIVDLRGHGLSGGNYCTMGILDRHDIVAWANYLVDHYGQDIRILLHGVSMGAASVVSASGEKDLPKQVVGIVSDCAFSSIDDVFDDQLKSVPSFLAKYIKSICYRYAKKKAGFDLYEASPLSAVQKTNVPIVFIQGLKDTMVSADMAKKLFDACHSKKEILFVEEANHAESIAYDEASYHAAITRLLQN